MLRVGQSITVQAKYKRNGALTDPGVATFHLKKPGESAYTTYTYPTSPEIVKEATGIFSILLELTLAGSWYSYWKGTAPVQQEARADFSVGPAI